MVIVVIALVEGTTRGDYQSLPASSSEVPRSVKVAQSLTGAVGIVLIAGLFDVGGNALYVVAREQMHLGLAAALVGVYPVVTMLLARVLIGERLPRLGQQGVDLALLGIVLISIGAEASSKGATSSITRRGGDGMWPLVRPPR